jgi:hypothetical protein
MSIWIKEGQRIRSSQGGTLPQIDAQDSHKKITAEAPVCETKQRQLEYMLAVG